MKKLICALALASMTATAGAQECKKYVHELDRDEWMAIKDGHLRWHTAPEEKRLWTVKVWDEYPNGPVRWAYVPDAENDVDQVVFRLVELDGVSGLIFEGIFYKEEPCMPESAVEALFER